MLVKYNPNDINHKCIEGAISCDTDCQIRLLVDTCIDASAITLCIIDDKTNVTSRHSMAKDVMFDNYDSYISVINLPDGLYWYYFEMDGVPYERFIGRGSDNLACLFYDNVNAWQLSVYDKQYCTPKWLNDGVMYQIMVDRFCPKGKVVATEDKQMRRWGEQPYYQELDGTVTNRDFFGGTIKGVISKLNYLKSLNVTTIYLNPIFSAYSNHKYDTEDYESIDSMFGTKEDFDELISRAKKLDMRIILDGVFNHVGYNSKYFNHNHKWGEGGAYNDHNSPYRKWFNFRADNSYDSWWNFVTLPRLNASEPSVQQYFCGENGIVPHWITEGIGGWRLDVVDEINDNMLDLIVSSAKKVMPDSAIIGEVWEDASNKMAYGVRRRYFGGKQLDSVMNYPLKDAIIEFVRYGNAGLYKKVSFDQLNNYPLYVRNNLMNILGTHDTKRILTALAGDVIDNAPRDVLSRVSLKGDQYKRGISLLQLAVVLQYTSYGFPSLYYGDEAGVEGYRDPFCRGCYPWGHENKQLLDFYTRMGQLRSYKVFADGSFNVLTADNGVIAYSRQHNPTNCKVIVVVSRSNEVYRLHIDGVYRDYMTGRSYNCCVDVQPNSYLILVKENM